MKISRRNAISQAIAGIFVIGLTPVSTAWATGVVAGATEPTQIANNVELVLQYAKQVQQYATQLQQWQNQIQNTLKCGSLLTGGLFHLTRLSKRTRRTGSTR